MTDVDDWEDDYDRDPFENQEPPEPNCFTCGDSGRFVDYTKRRPLFGRPRRSRRCPGCDPNWWYRLTGPVRQWWVWRKVKREQPSPDDPWASGTGPF